MQNIWFITRQSYWPERTKIVEIALGGRDYSNADALCKKYEGEFVEFADPREAARTAIAICKAWRNDGAKSAKVALGFTAGFTMPFEPTTFKDILANVPDDGPIPPGLGLENVSVLTDPPRGPRHAMFCPACFEKRITQAHAENP